MDEDKELTTTGSTDLDKWVKMEKVTLKDLEGEADPMKTLRLIQAAKARKGQKRAPIGLRLERLTIKQKIFCDNYLVHQNGAEAARQAGYSKGCARGQASKLLSLPNIKHYLNKRLNDALQANNVKPEDIIRDLRKISMDESANNSDRIRCLELLGKNLGMFRDSGTGPNVAVFQAFNRKDMAMLEGSRPQHIVVEEKEETRPSYKVLEHNEL